MLASDGFDSQSGSDQETSRESKSLELRLGIVRSSGPIVGTNLCINLHSHAKTNAADLPFLCREQVIIRKCAGAFEFISRMHLVFAVGVIADAFKFCCVLRFWVMCLLNEVSIPGRCVGPFNPFGRIGL